MELKKCLIDELGFSNLKNNGFEPTYNSYIKDEKLIIRVEIPGNDSISYKIEYLGEYTFIKLFGMKKKDKEPEKLEDIIYNTREFGEFTSEIPFKTEDYLIKNEKPEVIEKKGLIMLEFKLDKNKINETINSDQNKDEV